MIEKLAIVAIALLSQLNITSENQSNVEFLDKFIKQDAVNIQFNLQEENWSYYDNLAVDICESTLQPLPYKIKGASHFNVNAKAAVVLDSETDAVLYSKSSDKKFPVASLTKIMTALVVLDNAGLDETVTINQRAFSTAGSKNGLAVGEKITVENLLKIMLVNSNNIAANALAEHINGNVGDFVGLMNKKADLIGLENTEFLNPSGLDSAKGDNISTAYEISQLVDYALEKPLLWEVLRTKRITVASADGKIKHHLKNTNLLLGKLENIVGGKTGLTDNAGQCLVLVVSNPDNNYRIISVVLNADDRFSETSKLIDWVFKSYKW